MNTIGKSSNYLIRILLICISTGLYAKPSLKLGTSIQLKLRDPKIISIMTALKPGYKFNRAPSVKIHPFIKTNVLFAPIISKNSDSQYTYDIKLLNPNSQEYTLEWDYQICYRQELCFPPMTKSWHINVDKDLQIHLIKRGIFKRLLDYFKSV